METKFLCRSGFVWLLLTYLTGCSSLSATVLRCGTDGPESSYVELINLDDQVLRGGGELESLCGFRFEPTPNQT